MLHAGLDMHKRFSVVTVTDEVGKEMVKGKRLDNDEEEIRSFFEDFDDDVKVVLEAGATGTGCATSSTGWASRTSCATR